MGKRPGEGPSESWSGWSGLPTVGPGSQLGQAAPSGQPWAARRIDAAAHYDSGRAEPARGATPAALQHVEQVGALYAELDHDHLNPGGTG